MELATRENVGKTVDYAAGRNRYIGYLISIATKSFKSKKVALDCANGAAFTIAKSVFDALGAETLVINNKPDGTNINVNCGSTHMESLCELVKKEKCDIGFAYDGDADRCLAVDEDGNVVDGDAILYICGKYMKEKDSLSNNTVVTTVMSNLGLYKAFDKEGIKYEKTAVGDKYVYESMLKNGYNLGGEQSGHIIFSKHASTGDGILTSLKVMEVLLEKKESLKNLTKDLKIYPQLLKNVRVKDKNAAGEDSEVKAVVEEISKELADEGRILLRPSGTEPLIRIMVEAKTEDICNEDIEKVVKVMRKRELLV